MKQNVYCTKKAFEYLNLYKLTLQLYEIVHCSFEALALASTISVPCSFSVSLPLQGEPGEPGPKGVIGPIGPRGEPVSMKLHLLCMYHKTGEK